MKDTKPDYRRIYTDIINKKFPEKKDSCLYILNKEELSALDVITLNTIIFGSLDTESREFNQKHKSYDVDSIRKILDYKKNNNLSNIEMSKKFKLSRNTISKWNKFFH
ncbi:helix-turn-helix domain-containing protein [Chryseobacterium sp. Tr-659]|uniref:helix-turn-helix domain-containing protein n=1 Tax=Chryseobacterium sp. Tr-659 TaxID=2608340 RepID=UPI00141E7399|nr:helix-turn-helix domain-containing protein [Chryseobacterium sp. Tr-659]NIF06809.1 helix-turn-helix domain-containing protein [Chryseobacterium sp. Tr-659]